MQLYEPGYPQLAEELLQGVRISYVVRRERPMAERGELQLRVGAGPDDHDLRLLHRIPQVGSSSIW